jgi:hypothetical protein
MKRFALILPTLTVPRILRAMAIVPLLAAPLTQVQAKETKFALGSNVTFRYYGWLNIAGQSVEDGVSRTSNLVDVDNAPSRFGFFIEPVNGGPLSFQFETSLGFRPSSQTSQTNTPKGWDWSRRNLRQVQAIVRTGIGTFRLGQGSMTTDGAAEVDLGGTVVVAKATIAESHGGFEFRDSTGALSGKTIGNAFDSFDGARRFRVRFDTNERAGFSFAVAYGQEVLTSGNDNDYYDFALRYQKSTGGFDIRGTLGINYEDTPTGRTSARVGSISLLHRATGLNLSFDTGHAGDGKRESYIYLKGGWNAQLLSVGTTKFIIETFLGDDYLVDQSLSTMWGIGVIQEFDNQNLEVYAGYRGFSFEEPAPAVTTYQDISAVQFGARWQF